MAHLACSSSACFARRRLEQRSYCNESPEELLTPVATARENQGCRSSRKSACPSKIGKTAPVELRDWLSRSGVPGAFRSLLGLPAFGGH